MSQNHRIVGVGRELCGSSSPTLLPKQGLIPRSSKYVGRRIKKEKLLFPPEDTCSNFVPGRAFWASCILCVIALEVFFSLLTVFLSQLHPLFCPSSTPIAQFSVFVEEATLLL